MSRVTIPVSEDTTEEQIAAQLLVILQRNDVERPPSGYYGLSLEAVLQFEFSPNALGLDVQGGCVRLPGGGAAFYGGDRGPDWLRDKYYSAAAMLRTKGFIYDDPEQSSSDFVVLSESGHACSVQLQSSSPLSTCSASTPEVLPPTRERPAPQETMDIGIVIALKEEFAVFHNLLKDSLTHEPDPKLKSHYYTFTRPHNQGAFRCVATFAGQMGHTKAAVVADRLRARWAPNFIANIGIAAAIDKDITIGDVIIPTIVDSYLDRSKAVPSKDGTDWDFELAGHPYNSDAELVGFSQNLMFAKSDQYAAWQSAAAERLRDMIAAPTLAELIGDELLADSPKTWEGHIASGPTVGSAAGFLSWLGKRDRSYLALDMESAGVMEAIAPELTDCRPFVIRAASDYGDERKKELDAIGKGVLRRYAMENAINFLWLFMDTGGFGEPSLGGEGANVQNV